MPIAVDLTEFDSSKVAADIEEALDFSKFKITWTDVANAVGLSKSSFSHLKNGTEMKFFNLLGVANFLFKTRCIEKFKQWCLSFNQPQNIRYALEYLAVNRQKEELDKLIKKVYEGSRDQKLLNIAKGYEILLMYLNDKDSYEVLSEIRRYEPKTLEMKILASVIEIWALNRLREYNTMQTLITGLESNVVKIKDEYIKKSYTLRIKEAKSFIYLYKLNDVSKARMLANEIIKEEFSATFTANASFILGMSYLFDDYEACLGYMNKYKLLLIESGRDQEVKTVENNNIPFINNCWKRPQNSSTTIDPSERAHSEAIFGDKRLAVKLIEETIEKEGVSGFKLYYKALATQDEALFMQSMVYFVSKKGDKFFANLPYQYLKESPAYKPIADLLMGD